jgi:hypothetical protein
VSYPETVSNVLTFPTAPRDDEARDYLVSVIPLDQPPFIAGVPIADCISICRLADRRTWIFRADSKWCNSDTYALGRIASGVGILSADHRWVYPERRAA